MLNTQNMHRWCLILWLNNGIRPNYLDTFTLYNTCPETATSPFHYLLICLKIAVISKQCRLWPVAESEASDLDSDSLLKTTVILISTLPISNAFYFSTKTSTGVFKIRSTVNPLYNDTRYNDKIRYNDNLNVMKPSLEVTVNEKLCKNITLKFQATNVLNIC